VSLFKPSLKGLNPSSQGVGGAASEGAVERDGLLDWLLAARDDSDGGDGGTTLTETRVDL
jgi:hypothetical protein